MARWTRTETVLRRVTHTVPTPAHHSDLHAALDAAVLISYDINDEHEAAG